MKPRKLSPTHYSTDVGGYFPYCNAATRGGLRTTPFEKRVTCSRCKSKLAGAARREGGKRP